MIFNFIEAKRVSTICLVWFLLFTTAYSLGNTRSHSIAYTENTKKVSVTISHQEMLNTEILFKENIKAKALNIISSDYGITIVNEVLKQSEKTGLPVYVIYSLIHTESDFYPKAKSRLGAPYGRGLMQVSFFALKDYNEKHLGIYNRQTWKINPDDLYDIKNNLEVGCWYFSRIINVILKGNCTYQDAYIAYNVGPALFKAQKNNLYNGFYINSKGIKVKYNIPKDRYLTFENKYSIYFYGA